MLTRAEVGNMSDHTLIVTADGCRHRLRADWQKGAPGRLPDVYDLALASTEALLRGLVLPGPILPGQLEFDFYEYDL